MFRFSLKSNQEQLPVWVKPHVANYDKFGVVQRELVRFFKNAESKVVRDKLLVHVHICIYICFKVYDLVLVMP